MQVGDVQFQRSGGRRAVALVRRQRAANGFSLKRVGRLAQIDVSRRGRRCRRLSRQHRRRHRKLEMLRLQDHFITGLGGPRQHHRPMDSMLQLAHVARPGPLLQPVSRRLSQNDPRQPHPQAALLAEIARQQHHVTFPLA